MRDTCGNYQYLSAIYANQPVGIPLRQAIAAVGLAGLANFWKAPSIMAQANNAYCTTLRLINTGLGNIEEAKSDQTVVAILLLGLYEVRSPPRNILLFIANMKNRQILPMARGP